MSNENHQRWFWLQCIGQEWSKKSDSDFAHTHNLSESVTIINQFQKTNLTNFTTYARSRAFTCNLTCHLKRKIRIFRFALSREKAFFVFTAILRSDKKSQKRAMKYSPRARVHGSWIWKKREENPKSRWFWVNWTSMVRYVKFRACKYSPFFGCTVKMEKSFRNVSFRPTSDEFGRFLRSPRERSTTFRTRTLSFFRTTWEKSDSTMWC